MKEKASVVISGRVQNRSNRRGETVEKERREVLCSRSPIDRAVGRRTEQSNLYEELSDRASKHHLYIDHGGGHRRTGCSPAASRTSDIRFQHESDISRRGYRPVSQEQ